MFRRNVTSSEAIDGVFGTGTPYGVELDAVDSLKDIDTDWRNAKTAELN